MGAYNHISVPSANTFAAQRCKQFVRDLNTVLFEKTGGILTSHRSHSHTTPDPERVFGVISLSYKSVSKPSLQIYIPYGGKVLCAPYFRQKRPRIQDGCNVPAVKFIPLLLI